MSEARQKTGAGSRGVDSPRRWWSEAHKRRIVAASKWALRGIALGRRSWLFAGSDRGGERAVAMYTLIVTAKLNDVDPQAWRADVLARIAELSHTRVHELLLWNWKAAWHHTLAV